MMTFSYCRDAVMMHEGQCSHFTIHEFKLDCLSLQESRCRCSVSTLIPNVRKRSTIVVLLAEVTEQSSFSH